MSTPKRRIVALALLAFLSCAATGLYMSGGAKHLGGIITAFFKGSHGNPGANTAVASATTSGGFSNASSEVAIPSHDAAPQELHHMGGFGGAQGTHYGTGEARSHLPDANPFTLGAPSAGPSPGSFAVAAADAGRAAQAPSPSGAAAPQSTAPNTPFFSGTSASPGGPDTTSGKKATTTSTPPDTTPTDPTNPPVTTPPVTTDPVVTDPVTPVTPPVVTPPVVTPPVIVPPITTPQDPTDTPTGTDTPQGVSTVPEPSSLLMMGLGALALFAVGRKRKSA